MGGDDDVDLLPTGGRGTEAFGGVDGGGEEALGTAGDELAESVVAAMAVAASAAGKMVEEVGVLLVEIVTDGNRFGRWV